MGGKATECRFSPSFNLNLTCRRSSCIEQLQILTLNPKDCRELTAGSFLFLCHIDIVLVTVGDLLPHPQSQTLDAGERQQTHSTQPWSPASSWHRHSGILAFLSLVH